jgi:KipI family sensor histidine kinase inhibitor
VNVFSYGVEALLVEVDSPDEAAALRAQLTRSPPPGTTEALPGLRTVLIRFDRRTTDARALARQLTDLVDGAPPADADTGRPDDEAVLVRVSYDGDDLDDVAAHTGLTVDAVIAAHQARAYRVTLIGMAPGFYFLSGGDPRLDVPRRPSPRQQVPRGAVGLAGPLTGIYPKRGPGGWQLIGQVLDNLWHSTRLPAALLAPGAAVRFTAAKR